MATISHELRIKVINKIQWCIDTLADHYGTRLDFPAVTFKTKGTTAGWANYSEWKVDFNPLFLEAYQDEFINQTVPHEIAHLMDYVLHPENFYGRRKRSVHGPTWKSIMVVLGAEPRRCHSYDSSIIAKRRSKKTFPYQCEKCHMNFELAIRRHNKSQKGAIYRHKNCGGTLVYIGQENHQQKKVASAPKQKTTTRKTNGTSKIDRAVDLVDNYFTGANRKEVIEILMFELEMSKAGAQTYFYNAKERLGL